MKNHNAGWYFIFQVKKIKGILNDIHNIFGNLNVDNFFYIFVLLLLWDSF